MNDISGFSNNRTTFILKYWQAFAAKHGSFFWSVWENVLPSNIMKIIVLYNTFVFLILMLFCLDCLIFINISYLFFYFIYILIYNDDLFIVFIHLITQMTRCWGIIELLKHKNRALMLLCLFINSLFLLLILF